LLRAQQPGWSSPLTVPLLTTGSSGHRWVAASSRAVFVGFKDKPQLERQLWDTLRSHLKAWVSQRLFAHFSAYKSKATLWPVSGLSCLEQWRLASLAG
jgi:hypothetical protein